jgi:hypothetical protein
VDVRLVTPIEEKTKEKKTSHLSVVRIAFTPYPQLLAKKGKVFPQLRPTHTEKKD